MGEKPIPRKASPEEQAAEAARIAEEIKLVAARREKEELEMKQLEEELREIEAAHRAQCKVRDEARSKRRNLEKGTRWCDRSKRVRAKRKTCTASRSDYWYGSLCRSDLSR